MSFRSRLTTFFLLIVMVPMVGVGLLVFRLISDSQTAKINARASGLATTAASLYQNQAAIASAEAGAIAKRTASLSGARLRSELRTIVARAGVAQIQVTRDGKVIADIGDRTAIAPGSANARAAGGRILSTVTVSGITASEYARDLAGAGVAVIIRQGGEILGSTVTAPSQPLGSHGQLTVHGVKYRFVSQAFHGFDGAQIEVTVLSQVSATSNSAGTSRAIAVAFIAAFLLLAFGFAIAASRALEGQLGRFLQAARRLAGGDFSSPVPIEGDDEFADLGREFNTMSEQLEHRLEELTAERRRLRDSIRRIGATFASNLDRPALLELALRACVDAVRADCGRLTSRARAGEPLSETLRIGHIAGHEESFLGAERIALRTSELGEAASTTISVAALTLGSAGAGGTAVLTVGRAEPFSDDDRELMRSLARQATLALENVQLHFQVRRQAVTDELTGLANHGRFQELMSSEMEQVRRYHHPVSLVMIDIDNFKKVNDTYGHQQGDVVLKEVARVVRESSRDADAPARYGGEELALILPHTDIEGAYAIAERVRTAIESLRVARVDGEEPLHVTASLGVAAATGGEKVSLIADADAALYTAKRSGKNRTVRAPFVAANAGGSQ